jgi:septal ring factor EnvC (AmiA/AmiB activator)
MVFMSEDYPVWANATQNTYEKMKADIADLESRLRGRTTIIREINDEIRKRDVEISQLKADIKELEAAAEGWHTLYEKCKAAKGHEYEVSCMVDKSLGFLEKKVERADMLIRNPHKIFFTKAKKPKEMKA